MKHTRTLSLLSVILLLSACGTGPEPEGTLEPQAQTITVTTTRDVYANDGACSLREAIVAANTDQPLYSFARFGECPKGSGTDTIVLAQGQTYPLTRAHDPLMKPHVALPLMTSVLVLEGQGATLQISSHNSLAFMAVEASGNVSLKNLTLRDAHTTKLDEPIIYNSGVLNGNNIVFEDNHTVHSSVVANDAQLTLDDCTFRNNKTDDGSAVIENTYYTSEMTLRNCLIENNDGGVSGHIIENSDTDGVLVIENSTLKGNIVQVGNVVENWGETTLKGSALLDHALDDPSGFSNLIYNAWTLNVSDTLISGVFSDGNDVVVNDGAATLERVTIQDIHLMSANIITNTWQDAWFWLEESTLSDNTVEDGERDFQRKRVHAAENVSHEQPPRQQREPRLQLQ